MKVHLACKKCPQSCMKEPRKSLDGIAVFPAARDCFHTSPNATVLPQMPKWSNDSRNFVKLCGWMV